MALSSSHGAAKLFVENKSVRNTSEANLEASPKAYESKLSDAQHRMQEVDIINETFNQLEIKVGVVEKELAALQKHVQYPEDRVAEQSN